MYSQHSLETLKDPKKAPILKNSRVKPSGSGKIIKHSKSSHALMKQNSASVQFHPQVELSEAENEMERRAKLYYETRDRLLRGSSGGPNSVESNQPREASG